jgi:hypothetical protein
MHVPVTITFIVSAAARRNGNLKNEKQLARTLQSENMQVARPAKRDFNSRKEYTKQLKVLVSNNDAEEKTFRLASEPTCEKMYSLL